MKILIVGGLKRSFTVMGTVKSAIFHANDAGTADLHSAVLLLPKKSEEWMKFLTHSVNVRASC